MWLTASLFARIESYGPYYEFFGVSVYGVGGVVGGGEGHIER